ncbi:TetR/AcrR family transcriptional regulator [Sphingobacterium alkalisoli]|uniref:TetR/AcrR family transcriptional regulator n=1 Tax=Sphingobacterium alkalisoli TaxID=1874115 RepID=A0A4U0H8G6_9SPHI|nr:TetR/AcrR family transcriptional regulator [Sphingobacterium alkalisoli]TJY68101.1 TetR/AcrR family transcriptional regulator [Sphingobacterium alkalisoli]GGH09063.1 hypothetical protein GCM10011418_06850 [Sphingobacterium alkalisoli]
MIENKKTKKSLITKSKLLGAVEKVLTEKGFTELKVQPICDASNVDKKLIYFHFGDLEGLLTEFLRRNDFWLSKMEVPKEMNKETVKEVLTNQFSSIYESDLLKQLLIWELSEGNETLKKIARDREQIGNQMIADFIKQQDFKTDIPPLLALLVSGIYYLTIHSAINGSTFCGIDINTESDRERVLNTITGLIDQIK